MRSLLINSLENDDLVRVELVSKPERPFRGSGIIDDACSQPTDICLARFAAYDPVTFGREVRPD